MNKVYKKALQLTKDKGYVSIAMLILGMKPLGFELDYLQASVLVDMMVKDGVVKRSVIDKDRIDKLLIKTL